MRRFRHPFCCTVTPLYRSLPCSALPSHSRAVRTGRHRGHTFLPLSGVELDSDSPPPGCNCSLGNGLLLVSIVFLHVVCIDYSARAVAVVASLGLPDLEISSLVPYVLSEFIHRRHASVQVPSAQAGRVGRTACPADGTGRRTLLSADPVSWHYSCSRSSTSLASTKSVFSSWNRWWRPPAFDVRLRLDQLVVGDEHLV